MHVIQQHSVLHETVIIEETSFAKECVRAGIRICITTKRLHRFRDVPSSPCPAQLAVSFSLPHIQSRPCSRRELFYFIYKQYASVCVGVSVSVIRAPNSLMSLPLALPTFSCPRASCTTHLGQQQERHPAIQPWPAPAAQPPSAPTITTERVQSKACRCLRQRQKERRMAKCLRLSVRLLQDPPVA